MPLNAFQVSRTLTEHQMTVFNPFRISSGTLQILLCSVLLTTQIASGKSLDGDDNIESQAFPRIGAALRALSMSYHRRSIREEREFMAAILEDNGVYRVMVQAGSPGKHRVRMTIRRKKSQTLVALWHTHWARVPTGERFSATDRRTARTTGVPFYLHTPRGQHKRLGSYCT